MTPQRLWWSEPKSQNRPGGGGTPPVLCRPGVRRASATSIHHEVNDRSLCALIRHDERDRRRVTKCWSWLVLCYARLARRSHLRSAHRGCFLLGDPGTPELPGNPGGGVKSRKLRFLPRPARGMFNFATMQFCHFLIELSGKR